MKRQVKIIIRGQSTVSTEMCPEITRNFVEFDFIREDGREPTKKNKLFKIQNY